MNSFFEILKHHDEINPNSLALKYQDEELSYRDFFKLTRKFAHFINKELKINKLEQTVFIPIIFERSFWIPVSIHSLFFINKAYVPLDPNIPDERLKFLLSDIGSKIVISNSLIKERIESLELDYIVIDVEALAFNEMSELIDEYNYGPKDPCYMIYTSGTTGNPKGVVNIREGLMNRIEWMKNHYSLNQNSIFILKTPYTFDVSVWELTLPFLVGGTLVIGGPRVHQKMNELFRLIETHKVTDIHFVPSVFHVFLDLLNGKELTSLMHIYCSGEGLSTELTRKFFQTGIRSELHNLYGPTECSIDVSYWQCSIQDCKKYTVTPIGYPIDKTYFYVVDEKLNRVAKGEMGELLIGGIGVAAEYYKLPQLTEEKFIDDLYNPENGKLYRTGDLVKLGENNAYEFFGRIDFQVKINGQRVELGEIENTLMKVNGIRRVAVVYEKKQIFAFIEKSNLITDDEIVEFLKEYLPIYMIPNKVITLDSIPLNASGKTDRKVLLNYL